MKILVDKLPNSPSECPFSEWYPFGVGCYKCKLVGHKCDFYDREKENECLILKENDK